MALVRLGTVRLAVVRISLLSLGVLGLVSPAEAQFGWVKTDELSSPNPNPPLQGPGRFYVTDVSDDGEVVVVGAPHEHHGGFRSGAVYVYSRIGQAPLVLKASFLGTVDNEQLGTTVRISGDGQTVLASRTGTTIVYRETAGAWSVFPTTTDLGIGDLTSDGSRIFGGFNVAGVNWTAISAAGIVTTVTEPWELGAPFLNAQSPQVSVANDGRTIAVGTPFEGPLTVGAAYVLSLSEAGWRVTTLGASYPFPEDEFGGTVAVSDDGSTVMVSSNKLVGATPAQRGKLYVFTRGQAGWPVGAIIESEQVPSPSGGSFTGLGAWVSLSSDGRFAAVGFDLYPGDSFLILDRSSAPSKWTPIRPPVCQDNIRASWPAIMSGDGDTVVLGLSSCFVPAGVVFAYRRFAIPAIEWTPQGTAEHGTLLTAVEHLNATSDVPGTFTYNPPEGTVLQAPSATVWMTFAPDDTATYMPVTQPWIIVVTPATPVLQWTPPAAITFPTTLSAAQLNATANAPGTIAYTPAAGVTLGLGTHTLKAVFTPENPLQYRSIEATVPLTVLEPPPPTGFTARVNGNSVTFRWQRPPGVSDTGFLIEGGVLPGQTLATFGTPSGATERQFTVPSGAFYVRVHALISGRKGLPSNEIRIFVNVPVLPDPPANLLGMVNGSEVALSWTNTPGSPPPTGLRLNVTGALTLSVPLPVGEAFTFPSVPPGTYTFTVTTVNANGASIPSNPVTLSFPSGCTGSPSPPSAMVANRNGNLVSVTWDAPATGPAVTGYRLDVTGDFVGSFSTRTRALAGRVGSGSYTLSVVAINSCGTSAATTPTTILVP